MSDSDRQTAAGLTYADWNPEGATTVLALHGLTSTSEVWRAFAESLPEARVIAPDLAGRGGSVGADPGPGLAGHADSVVRLADELGLGEVTLIGHSMGAFLAPLVAAGLGGRVTKVILVDGGIAPDPSPVVRRPVVRALFWLSTRMLDKRWRDVQAYARVTEGKAVANRPDLRPRLVQWATYMLAGPPGNLRPRIRAARLIDDAADSLAGEATLPALAGMDVPVHAIVAEHGKDDKAGPFISDGALAVGHVRLPRLTSRRIAANHLTLLFDPSLPDAVRTGTSSPG